MINMKLLQENPESLKQACRNKNVDDFIIDRACQLDEKSRKLTFNIETLQNQKNVLSKEIGNKRINKIDSSKEEIEVKEINEQINSLKDQRSEISINLQEIVMKIPNATHSSVPFGKGEQDNIVIETFGNKPQFDFTPRPHWELCKSLDLIDFERGTKLSGSGFILYNEMGAKLERALISFFLDVHEKQGYTEWFPPYLVNEASMYGTGQLPKMQEDMYRCDKEDNLYLIPTAEVPITNIHRDEVLNNLPYNYMAYSACFRREAGSAGKDTRGLLRMHQFNKVEMVKFTNKETSYVEHEKLKNDAQEVLKLLGLHYRTLLLCSGDTSFSAAKCYDFEAYAPGIDRFLEVSSCSNFEDFQARRANIKYKDENGKSQFIHTLNSSGLATPRTMAAILETYQQKDGSVVIPEVLRKYLNGREIIEP